MLIVVDRVVAFHAGRIHGELVAGASIVIRVNHDLQLIGGCPDVAPSEELENRVGMRVECPNEDVDVTVVVGNFGFGREAGISILLRLELTELSDRRRRAPDLVVVPAVDEGRVHRAHGRGRRGGRRANGVVCSGRVGLNDEGKQYGRRHGTPRGAGWTVRQVIRRNG